MKINKLESFKKALFVFIGFIFAIFIYGLLELIEPVATVKSPQLNRTGFKIDVVRGSHDLTLVP